MEEFMLQPPTEEIETIEDRYRFYREHKYVSFVLNDLERLIAKPISAIRRKSKKSNRNFNR